MSEVRDVLASVVGRNTVDGVGEDVLIFQEGVIDSLHLVELIEAFETRLGVQVASDELAPENFESVGAMARYLTRKRGS